MNNDFYINKYKPYGLEIIDFNYSNITLFKNKYPYFNIVNNGYNINIIEYDNILICNNKLNNNFIYNILNILYNSNLKPKYIDIENINNIEYHKDAIKYFIENKYISYK